MKLATTLLLVLLAPLQAHAAFVSYDFGVKILRFDPLFDPGEESVPCPQCWITGRITFSTFLNGTPAPNGLGKVYDSNVQAIGAQLWTNEHQSVAFGPHQSRIATFGVPIQNRPGSFFSSVDVGADGFSFGWQRNGGPALPLTLDALMGVQSWWHAFGRGAVEFRTMSGRAIGRAIYFRKVSPRVPEPGTFALLALALGIFAVSYRAARSSDQ